MRRTAFIALFFLVCTGGDAAERTILFVDGHDVHHRSGTRKEVQPLRKFEGNPVIAPDRPWEGMIGWVSTWRDPQSGRCQMWYQAYNEEYAGDKRLKCVVAYAESTDGKKWVKPDLGLFPYHEVEKTNIVLLGAPGAYGDRYCNSVLVDPRDPDPARRYKIVFYDWEPDDERNLGAGLHVAFSPDGIRWTKHPGIVSKTSYSSEGMQPPFADEGMYLETPGREGRPRKHWRVPISMSDAQDVFYDARLGRYVSCGKMWMMGPDGTLAWKRGMGRIESADFIHWSKPRFILGPDDRDAPQIEFHTSPVFPYRGQYFSLNQILNRSAGIMEIELMCSRDGIAWERPYRDTHFLARGKPGAFDAATLLTNNTPLLDGDEMRFYYGAYRGTAIGGVGLGKQVIGTRDYRSGVGLAVIQRDRFVAIVPDPAVSSRNSLKVTRETVGKAAPKSAKPNTIGQVTLKPLDLRSVTEITINADASKGRVFVEILNEDGWRVRGFSKEDATAITADTLSGAVAWKEASLRDLKPGLHMLRIHIENAKLFAVTLR